MRIKPLARPGFTMFNNYVLDHIMPDLSSSGWKILCVAIRQTIGWADEETETGRKEQDRISHRQFQQKSGLGSSATVSKAIQECLGKSYLLRERSADHKQGFDYRLNMDYEIDVPETALETEAVLDETASETEAVLPKTALVSEATKERIKKGGGKKFVSPHLRQVEVEI